LYPTLLQIATLLSFLQLIFTNKRHSLQIPQGTEKPKNSNSQNNEIVSIKYLQKKDVSAMVTFAISSSSFKTSIFSTVDTVALDVALGNAAATGIDPSLPAMLLLLTSDEEGTTGSETPPSTSFSSKESDVSNPSGVKSLLNITLELLLVLFETNTLSIVAHSLPTFAQTNLFF
jgi:hypothetical protein